jgi:hypothetical protein
MNHRLALIVRNDPSREDGMETESELTHDEIIEIVGHIEDWRIAQIIATNANAKELLEAHTGVIEQGDLEAETERRMSGTVARLYDILLAGEPKWPESAESPEDSP